MHSVWNYLRMKIRHIVVPIYKDRSYYSWNILKLKNGRYITNWNISKKYPLKCNRNPRHVWTIYFVIWSLCTHTHTIYYILFWIVPFQQIVWVTVAFCKWALRWHFMKFSSKTISCVAIIIWADIVLLVNAF